jgi:NAD(P)-dependent dehydrogenase (short-subunit alcohol dehydrogenase family)
MRSTERLAIVTGANRGLGLETCRQLARQGYQVVLTSRDEAKGQAAAKALREAGGAVVYYPLDVTSQVSVAQLRDFIVRDFSGRADVLVNNAALYLDEGRELLEVELEIFRTTIETNVYGPLLLCQAFVPLMLKQNYGRVVNVSSGSGQLASMDSDTPAYRMSKVALNALTLMLAHRVRGQNILVNAVCPGWVRTDMGGPYASRSVEEGADTIVWLATLPDGGPSGGFFRDRQRIEW